MCVVTSGLVTCVRSCRLDVEAVELDPVIVQLARQHFGLPEGSHLQVRHSVVVTTVYQLTLYLPINAQQRERAQMQSGKRASPGGDGAVVRVLWKTGHGIGSS